MIGSCFSAPGDSLALSGMIPKVGGFGFRNVCIDAGRLAVASHQRARPLALAALTSSSRFVTQ